MPAPHDLDPPSMNDDERADKRRYDAYFAFEQMPPMVSRAQFGTGGNPLRVFEVDT